MEDPNHRAALDRHWAASASGDLETEHDLYDHNVLCEHPQSGEKIRGRPNLQPCADIIPANPAASASIA